MLMESLKIFCDLVEMKSFSRAAEANYVTQPAVSQQVRNLERIWKAPLLKRDRGNLSPTPAGDVVYSKSKIILEHYDEMTRLLKQAGRPVSGTVRIATIHGVGLHELPPYIQRFLKLHPGVNVNLEYMQDALVYRRMAERKADAGIVSFPVRWPHLEILPFRSDRLGIVCHPQHPLARHRRVALGKIQSMKFVAFKKGIPTRRVVDGILAKQKVSVRVSMEFDNIETLKRAVEIDVGISILPLVTVQSELDREVLKAVEIAGEPLFRDLGILLHRGKSRPEAVEKFVETLREDSQS